MLYVGSVHSNDIWHIAVSFRRLFQNGFADRSNKKQSQHAYTANWHFFGFENAQPQMIGKLHLHCVCFELIRWNSTWTENLVTLTNARSETEFRNNVKRTKWILHWLILRSCVFFSFRFSFFFGYSFLECYRLATYFCTCALCASAQYSKHLWTVSLATKREYAHIHRYTDTQHIRTMYTPMCTKSNTENVILKSSLRRRYSQAFDSSLWYLEPGNSIKKECSNFSCI